MDMTDTHGRALVKLGRWKWPGLYRGARYVETQWGDLMPDGHTSTDARGNDIPANSRRRTAASGIRADEDEAGVDPVAAFFAGFRGGGYSIEDGRRSDAAEQADPGSLDPRIVREYVGVTQDEFDVTAKRRTRAARNSIERATRQRVADRFADVLERVPAGRRTGAVTLLCDVYGTSRVMLGRLRDEGMAGRLR
jgi:hypothetical protein